MRWPITIRCCTIACILVAGFAYLDAKAGHTLIESGQLWIPDDTSAYYARSYNDLKDYENRYLDRSYLLKKIWHAHSKVGDVQRAICSVEKLAAQADSRTQDALQKLIRGDDIALRERNGYNDPAFRSLESRGGISMWRYDTSVGTIISTQFAIKTALEQYDNALNQYAGALRIIAKYSGPQGTALNAKDPRIVPYVIANASAALKRTAAQALQRRSELIAFSNEAIVSEIDKVQGLNITEKQLYESVASNPSAAFSDGLARANAPAFGRYHQLAQATFQHTLGPVQPPGYGQVMVQIDRQGSKERLFLASSSGDAKIDQAAMATAHKMTFNPVPVDYRGDRMYLLLAFWDAERANAQLLKSTHLKPARDVRLNPSEIQEQISQSREMQQREFDAKRLRYGIKYPWQDTSPYGILDAR